MFIDVFVGDVVVVDLFLNILMFGFYLVGIEIQKI